jgi:hypothetical protein
MTETACTAPVEGHDSPRREAQCPVCGPKRRGAVDSPAAASGPPPSAGKQTSPAEEAARIAEEAEQRRLSIGQKRAELRALHIAPLDREYVVITLQALADAVQTACPSFKDIQLSPSYDHGDPDGLDSWPTVVCSHSEGDLEEFESEHGLWRGDLTDHVGSGIKESEVVDYGPEVGFYPEPDTGMYVLTREALLTRNTGVHPSNAGALVALEDVAPNTLTPESPEVKMALAMHHNPAGG